MKTYVGQTLHKNETDVYNDTKKEIQKKLELLLITKERNIFYNTKEIKIIKKNI